MGQETEYLPFIEAPHAGFDEPMRPVLHAFIAAIRRKLPTAWGSSSAWGTRLFMANGGAICEEPGGMVEGMTPECNDPLELLLQQRAHDELIRDTIAEVEETSPYRGSLGVLKNDVDVDEHFYGTQENFEIDLGVWRWRCYRAAYVVAVVGDVVLKRVVAPALKRLWRVALHSSRASVRIGEIVDRLANRGVSGWEARSWLILAAARWFGFSRIVHPMLSFLITRQVFAGAGSLDETGAFWISQKARTVRVVWPRASKRDRPMIGTADIALDLFDRVAPTCERSS